MDPSTGIFKLTRLLSTFSPSKVVSSISYPLISNDGMDLSGMAIAEK